MRDGRATRRTFCGAAKKSAMYDADTRPGEYVDAGFQKKKLARLCEFFLLQKMCEKSTPRGKMREGADSFVKNAERLNGLHFPAAERSDCAQGKTAPLPRCGRREAQITTRRRRFPKQKAQENDCKRVRSCGWHGGDGGRACRGLRARAANADWY